MKTFTPFREISNHIITRVLPANSNLLIKEHDQLTPSDLLAELKPSAGFHKIDLATALGISPKNAHQYIVRKEGERIYKGEILAKRTKMFSKNDQIVTVPIDGVIQHIDAQTGQVLLKMIRKQEFIPAGLWGKVLKITTNEVQIETNVLEVNGRVGRGFERGGALKIIANRHETISEHMIKEDQSGKVIVGGSHITREAISKCVNYGIVGCICGGIDYKDILAVTANSDVGVSIVILEGFGTIPINEKTFETLKRCENYYAFVNGKERKLTIPLESLTQSQKHSDSKELEKGDTVRILADAMIGQTGEVKDIMKAHVYPSGIATDSVRIMDKNLEYIVPIANIEILT